MEKKKQFWKSSSVRNTRKQLYKLKITFSM